MAKKKLLDDIMRDPGRYYRVPGDVMRDRRFDDGERLEILKAWRDASLASPGGETEAEIARAITELESRGPASHGRAAE